MITHIRVASQQLEQPRFESPKELVSWMGAIQAQEYALETISEIYDDSVFKCGYRPATLGYSKGRDLFFCRGQRRLYSYIMITHIRVASQQLEQPRFESPKELVSWMGGYRPATLGYSKGRDLFFCRGQRYPCG